MAPKRVLSRHPSAGMLIGLDLGTLIPLAQVSHETSRILRALKTQAVSLHALFHLASDGVQQLVGGLCTSTRSWFAKM